jgi:hypothetical protein
VDREAKAAYPLRVFLPAGVDGLSPEAIPPSVTVHARRVVAPEPKPEPTVRTEETSGSPLPAAAPADPVPAPQLPAPTDVPRNNTP